MTSRCNQSENSTNNNCNRTKSEMKFTRGEKCIFIHLVLTFVMIIILVILYFAHLCFVSHVGSDMFRVTRRTFAVPDGMYIHTLKTLLIQNNMQPSFRGQQYLCILIGDHYRLLQSICHSIAVILFTQKVDVDPIPSIGACVSVAALVGSPFISFN